MYKAILCSLVLAGCAGSLTNAELLEAAIACGPVDRCPDEWAAWNKSEERRKTRERKNQQCPKGFVKYRGGIGSEGCIAREKMDDFMKSLQRGY
jgi:hypothetical protein